MTVSEAEPFRVQSLRGHTDSSAEGFPRHHPPSIASSSEAAGSGFAVMSGFLYGIASVTGQLSYPTRNFADPCYQSLNRDGVGRFRQPPHVAMGIGPSHPLFREGRRMVSEGSGTFVPTSLLIFRTDRIVTP
jgi:hypothetical protein